MMEYINIFTGKPEKTYWESVGFKEYEDISKKVCVTAITYLSMDNTILERKQYEFTLKSSVINKINIINNRELRFIIQKKENLHIITEENFDNYQGKQFRGVYNHDFKFSYELGVNDDKLELELMQDEHKITLIFQVADK